MMRRREKIWLSSLALVLLVVAGGAWHYNRQAQLSELFLSFTYQQVVPIYEWVEDGGRVDAMYEGDTLLSAAILSRQDELSFFLLEKGADPNRKGRGMPTPTEYAAMYGSLAMLNACLGAGGELDPNAVHSDFSLLSSRMGSNADDHDVARFLLEQGAEPTEPWLLYWTVQQSDAEMVRMLCEYGADLTYQDPNNGRSVYHALNRWGLVVSEAVEKIEILYEFGAPIDLTDNRGLTPLQYLKQAWASYDDPDTKMIVKYLEMLDEELGN